MVSHAVAQENRNISSQKARLIKKLLCGEEATRTDTADLALAGMGYCMEFCYKDTQRRGLTDDLKDIMMSRLRSVSLNIPSSLLVN